MKFKIGDKVESIGAYYEIRGTITISENDKYFVENNKEGCWIHEKGLKLVDRKFKVGDKVHAKYDDNIIIGYITHIEYCWCLVKSEDKNHIGRYFHEEELEFFEDDELELVENKAESKSENGRTVDPKASQAAKKMTFRNIPATAMIFGEIGSKVGGDKYGIWNWLKLKDGTMSYSTYIDAMQRHLILLRAGQDFVSDADKVHHMMAIKAGCDVALDAIFHKKMHDDRIKLSEEQLIELEKLINKERGL